MAAKMVEQQKAKMANAVPTPMAAPPRSGCVVVAPGQTGITSFFKNKSSTTNEDKDVSAKTQEKPPLDELSQRGKTPFIRSF